MSVKLKPEEIDISKISHLQILISDIESSENIRRKKNAFIAFEASEGRQADHVKDKLQTLYPESHTKFRIADVEIPKKVIRKKAKAYKQQPLRVLSTEAQTAELNDVYDKFKFSRAFKEADKIYNLHKYVCLWLSYTNPLDDSEELEGEYNLRALAPYEYDLVVGKKGKPLIFSYSYASTDVTKGSDGTEQITKEDQRDTSADSKRYKFISKDYITEVVTYGATEGSPNITKMDVKPNEIERLPIAFLSQDTAVDYPIPSALARKSIDWNVEFSDLRTAAATQGHGQLTISHPEKIKIKKLHMGMFTSVSLPQSSKETDKPTTAAYINANPNLAGQLDVLKFSLLQIIDDEGITSKSSLEGGVDQVTSGFDRLLKEADVQDIIEDNQELYTDCLEQDVYLALKAMRDTLNNSTFSDDNLQVTFSKPKVLISDKETLENIEKREDLGTLLPHEKHMILNPNLSEEDAKTREEEIQAAKLEQAKKMASILGEPENEDDEDEEDAI